jgi:hypothetical protein
MATSGIPTPNSDLEIEALRTRNNLQRITPELEGMSLAQLPEGVYGYSFSSATPESPLFSNRQFQSFEWHKLHDGTVQVLGFAKPEEAAALNAGEEPVDFNLYPDPHEASNQLVCVPLNRIRRSRPPSRSDGNYIAVNVEPSSRRS